MTDQENKLVHAYHQLVEHAREWVVEARHDTGPIVEQAVDKAEERLAELGEYTREETERVSNYLKHDLKAAAKYVAFGEEELKDWMSVEAAYLKDKTWEAFSRMVDQTKLELDRLAYNAEHIDEWHTGHITAPGVLVCSSCGEQIHFEHTGHVPPCPKCNGTVFRRLYKRSELE